MIHEGASRGIWVGTHRLAIWWRAARPYRFTSAATPVVVGSSIAIHAGRFSPLLFLATLVGCVAIQAGTNLLNDYYDHTRGVDTAASLGPSGAILGGALSPDTIAAGGWTCLALGSVLGLWLASVAGWPVLVLGALGVLGGYAYSGGPRPLAYAGLGELVVFLVWGPMIVLGASYVQTRTLAPVAVWASVPMAALGAALVAVNNLRDQHGDRIGRKRTLATRFGASGARVEYTILVGGAYGVICLGVVVRQLPPLSLLTVLTLPLAARAWHVVRTEPDAGALNAHALAGTRRLLLAVGLLMAVALGS